MSAAPVTISLQGLPIGKERPRLSTYRGRLQIHTPKATRGYQESIRLSSFLAMRGHPQFVGAVHVDLRFQFAPPPSWSEKKKLAAIGGLIPHTSKPDADNLAKAWLDGMNGIVFSDDARVTKFTAEKKYGPTSLAVATVREPEAV